MNSEKMKVGKVWIFRTAESYTTDISNEQHIMATDMRPVAQLMVSRKMLISLHFQIWNNNECSLEILLYWSLKKTSHMSAWDTENV